MGTKVRIENHNGWLRLRWSYQGKRPTLALGWQDSLPARVMAQKKASDIEGDIITGNYDPTHKKYETYRATKSDLTAVELMQRFTISKTKLAVTTRSRYIALRVKVQEFFKGQGLSIDADKAQAFTSWLGESLSPATQLQYIGLMKSCWNWGIKQGLVIDNPWGEVLEGIKVPPKQKPRPFTQEEIKAILRGFREDLEHKHYGDFVEFLFLTGCRTGEAVGLRWSHLIDQCSKVWVGESVVRGVRKETKTNKDRTFQLSNRVTTMLLARRPEDHKPDDLVFPTIEGDAINTCNFRNREWKPVLEAMGVVYRKPYNTRHTFISHALDKGINPVKIAYITGHDIETLFKNYAAHIQGIADLPDIL
jgi:integrase